MTSLRLGPAVIERPAWIPRVSVYDGRAIEQAMAGSLLNPGVELAGALVEATFALAQPPLLKRLQEAAVPRLVDPQTLRFADEGFLAIERLSKLPYAPKEPLAPSLSPQNVRDVVAGALRFEQEHGSTAFVVPAAPLFDTGFEQWLELTLRLHRLAAESNGTGELERRPLIALIAPGQKALREPDRVFGPLADLPIDAAYIQPLRLNPVRDSVEKLVQYTRFCQAASDLGLSVFAGRVGAFGLIPQALGVVSCFDSGLGEAESFNLKALNRARSSKGSGRGGAGRDRRLYLEAVKTTLSARHAEVILRNTSIRSWFVCSLPCCRWRGFETLLDRRREHYLHVRQSEVIRIAGEPTAAMRVNRLHDHISQARDRADLVRRTFEDAGLEAPSFDHLDRWLGVLARVATAARTAA
jgi:hypothetical protein